MDKLSVLPRKWYRLRLHGTKGILFKKHIWVECRVWYEKVPSDIAKEWIDNTRLININLWKGYKFELVSIVPE